MKKETRVYVVSVSHAPEGNPCDYSDEAKEEFMTLAENQGRVYTLLGFQKALNKQELFIDSVLILITDVTVN